MQKLTFKAVILFIYCLSALLLYSCRKNVAEVAEQTIEEEPAPDKHGICEISIHYADGFDCSSLNDTVWNIVKPYLTDDARPPCEIELPEIFDLFKKENVLVFIELDGECDAILADYYWYLPSQGLLYYYDDEYFSSRLIYASAPQPTYAEIKEVLTQTNGNTTAAMNCEVRNNKVYSIQGLIRY